MSKSTKKNVFDQIQPISDEKHLGFGPHFPKALQERIELKMKCRPGNIPYFKVATSMLLMRVINKKNYSGPLPDLGDWIYAVNDRIIYSKKHFKQIMQGIYSKKHSKEEVKVNMTIYRTIKTRRMTDISSSQIPHGFGLQFGYQYLIGYVTVYPGSCLDIKMKSYNHKVYIVAVGKGYDSLSKRTFHVGDAILSINGETQNTVLGATKRIAEVLAKDKYASMIIERPETPLAREQVKRALEAKRAIELDPPLPDDVMEICKEELQRMVQSNSTNLTNIYASSKNYFVGAFRRLMPRPQLKFSSVSRELSIGMDSTDTSQLQSVPPSPGPSSSPTFTHLEKHGSSSELRTARSSEKGSSTDLKTARSPEKTSSTNLRTSKSPEKGSSTSPRIPKSPEKGSSTNIRTVKSSEKGSVINLKTAKSPQRSSSTDLRMAKSVGKGSFTDLRTARSAEKGSLTDLRTAKSAEKGLSIDSRVSKSTEKVSFPDLKSAKSQEKNSSSKLRTAKGSGKR